MNAVGLVSASWALFYQNKSDKFLFKFSYVQRFAGTFPDDLTPLKTQK